MKEPWYSINPCQTPTGAQLDRLKITPTNRETTTTICALKGRINKKPFTGIFYITEGHHVPGTIDGRPEDNNTQEILNTINLQLNRDNNQLIIKELQRICGP